MLCFVFATVSRGRVNSVPVTPTWLTEEVAPFQRALASMKGRNAEVDTDIASPDFLLKLGRLSQGLISFQPPDPVGFHSRVSPKPLTLSPIWVLLWTMLGNLGFLQPKFSTSASRKSSVHCLLTDTPLDPDNSPRVSFLAFLLISPSTRPKTFSKMTI